MIWVCQDLKHVWRIGWIFSTVMNRLPTLPAQHFFPFFQFSLSNSCRLQLPFGARLQSRFSSLRSRRRHRCTMTIIHENLYLYLLMLRVLLEWPTLADLDHGGSHFYIGFFGENKCMYKNSSAKSGKGARSLFRCFTLHLTPSWMLENENQFPGGNSIAPCSHPPASQRAANSSASNLTSIPWTSKKEGKEEKGRKKEK